MRIAVTGGRKYSETETVEAALSALLAKCTDPPMVLIHGGSSGVDATAHAWAWGARARGARIYIYAYPPEWRLYGAKAAEEKRNEKIIAAKPDLVVAFPGDRATFHLCHLAEKAGIAIQRVEGPTPKLCSPRQ